MGPLQAVCCTVSCIEGSFRRAYLELQAMYRKIELRSFLRIKEVSDGIYNRL